MFSCVKLFLCLCLVSLPALSQEQMRNFMAGPMGDQFRVVLAFTDPTQDGYKLQTMIIDLAPAKNKKDPPSSIQVDLTSTVRSLTTGAKQQKIIVIRWKKAAEIEFKCDGKWTRKDASPVVDQMVEVTNSVILSVSFDVKKPTPLTLPPELAQRIFSVLDGLNTADIPCLRDQH